MIECETLPSVTDEAWDGWMQSTGRARVYHSSAWMKFLEATQPGHPVWARIHEDGLPIGYFCGRVTRKFGLKLLGSPLPGWTSHYMGPVLVDGRSCSAGLLQALDRWAFQELGCAHFETLCPEIPRPEMEALNYSVMDFQSFLVDLRVDEETLSQQFSMSSRWSIRRAQREGLVVEEARDAGFMEEYYAQLEDVFAKQGLVPTYPRSRTEALFRHLGQDRLLLLRVRHPSGRCVATGIVTRDKHTGYLWGTASWRRDQKHRPNELLQWHVMLKLKQLGALQYDFGGGGEYKAKYGGVRIHVPWFHKSRYEWLGRLRHLYQSAFRARQRLRGRLRARKARDGDAGVDSPGE